MKEKVKEIQNIDDAKKEKIFEVLNKKRKPDNSYKDYIQSPKKNMFVLYKPIIDSNPNKKIIEKNLNENNINDINYFNQINPKKNYSFNALKKESTIFGKFNEVQNNEKNISIDNKINNNKKINNNINNKIINDDMNEILKKEEKKEYGDYICYKEQQIGSGSFGQVLYGVHKTKYLEVAVKIINSETSSEAINKEINFSKKLQKLIGFPIIYYTCVIEKKNIIVESLLGPSLDKLFKYCGRKFPLKTVCLIGKEMVKRLETMHEKGILHRDLKPNNLTWGNYNSSYNNLSNHDLINNNNKLDINTIYLIDFGLSCSFYEDNYSTKHYKLKNGFNFVGTLRYASLNSHKGIRQSRRDDLESMIYILIYFLKGKLPWQDIKAKQKEERHKLIFEIKSKVTIESLCKDIPQEFAELLKYVKSLQFDEKPYYCKFYSFFHNLIDKLKYEPMQENNFSYIWEKLLVDNMSKYDKNNDIGILQEAEKLIFKGYPVNLKNFTNYVIYNNKNRK